MKTLQTTILLLFFASYINGQTVDTVYVQSGDIKLHTVLTRPDNKRNTPLAIIVAGSGPTDLNGNQPGVKTNSYRYLSDALVQNNIATLRFDKRAIAKSIKPGLKETDLRFDQYGDDVVTLIEYFKGKGYRKIYIIGHSEGSLLGMMATTKTKVNGFISVSGIGNSADSTLKKQLKPKLPPQYYLKVVAIIDSLKSGFMVKNVPPELNSIFRPSVQPYMISWFRYNPAELMMKLDCPVLLIQGDKDIQVDLEEANILKAATKKGKLIIIPGMNHVLKTITGDLKDNYASYNNPDLPLNKELVSSIVRFINPKN